MPRGIPTIDELILSIHSAALEPDGWSRVGRGLLSALSAQSGIGIRVPSNADPTPWGVLIDFDPSAAAAYAEHWGRHDLWYRGAVRARRISTGLVSVDSQLVDPVELESSEFFNDYLKKLDIGRMIQVCLAAPEDVGGFGLAALSVYRGVGQLPFSRENISVLTALAPHLTVAAKNYWMAQSLRLLTHARANALDALNSAVFAIDRTQRLLFANRLGTEWLREDKWVGVKKGVLALATTIREKDRFAVDVRRASMGIGSTFLATHSVTGAEAQVSVTPIPTEFDLALSLGAAVSLIWITPTTVCKETAYNIASLFGLTPAERRILDRLITGADLSEASKSLHISIHTARTQLKSILRKTGRRSQSQLLMLSARLAALSSAQS